MQMAGAVVGAGGKRRAGLAKVGADRAVGGVELGVDDAALAAEPRPVGAVLAVALDREDGVDAVRLAQVEIILAMVGRHMDEACADVGGDEIASAEGAGEGVEFQRAFPILVLPAFPGLTTLVVVRVSGDVAVLKIGVLGKRGSVR